LQLRRRLLLAPAAAVDVKKAVLVTMRVDPEPWCGKAKDAIRAAGGIITHEYS